MIREQVGIFDPELDQSLRAGRILLGEQGITAQELALVPVDGETESGFDRGVLVGDVVTPVTHARLEAKRVHGVEAGMHETVFCTGLDDRVVDGTGIVVGDVQLPAEFADIAHAQREHGSTGDLDLSAPTEREPTFLDVGVREIGVGDLREE